MKGVLAALIGLAVAMSASSASAYLVEITISIPVASAADGEQLKSALDSAIGDVIRHAIAFEPTLVTLQHARIVDDRIYIVLLIADDDGEAMMQWLSAGGDKPSDSLRAPARGSRAF
ncbi:MAG TPA: hypothetical protein VFE97_01500 [Methylomirabilota bacterium]|nr:hypothetical protein [Methylomirabilota bacterium]